MSLCLLNRFGKCPLRCPPRSQTIGDCVMRDSYFPRPLGNSSGSPAKGQEVICRRIVRLIRGGAPPAVARLIIAVVIDAVKRVFLARARPHILIERRERFAPPFTDLDTAPPVTGVVFAVSVLTSLVHALPDVMLAGMTHSVPRSRGEKFASVATATQRVATPQACPAYNSFLTAVAMTEPRCIIVDRANIANNVPAAEPLAGQVFYTLVLN